MQRASNLSTASTDLVSTEAVTVESTLSDESIDELPRGPHSQDNSFPMLLPRATPKASLVAPSGEMEAQKTQKENKALLSLGKKEPLSTLIDEFKHNASFRQKVDKLRRHGYTGWRRGRGDGNCFYRACGFGLLEKITAAPPQQQAAWANSLRLRLESLRFDNAQEQEHHINLLVHITQLSRGLGWPDSKRHDMSKQAKQHHLLYASFRDSSSGLDLALVRALRHLTARYFLEKADDMEACNGISFRMLCDAQGMGSPDDFCQRVILPLGQEAQTLVFNACAPGVGVALHIAILDRGEASGLCFEHHEVGRNDAGVEYPSVHVQLRPGHYDLLYLQETFQDSWRETVPSTPSKARQTRPVTFGADGDDCEWNADESTEPSSPSQATLVPDLRAGYLGSGGGR